MEYKQGGRAGVLITQLELLKQSIIDLSKQELNIIQQRAESIREMVLLKQKKVENDKN